MSNFTRLTFRRLPVGRITKSSRKLYGTLRAKVAGVNCNLVPWSRRVERYWLPRGSLKFACTSRKALSLVSRSLIAKALNNCSNQA